MRADIWFLSDEVLDHESTEYFSMHMSCFYLQDGVLVHRRS